MAFLEAVHLQNDGFKELPGGADTGFSKNEFMAKAFYVLDPTSAVRHEFRIKGTYSDEALRTRRTSGSRPATFATARSSAIPRARSTG